VKLLTTGVEQPPVLQATAVMLEGPAGTLTWQLYVPDALAVVVHRVVLPGPVSVTTLPGVAVPETVGVVVAVPLLAGEVMATVGWLTIVIPRLLASPVGMVHPSGSELLTDRKVTT